MSLIAALALIAAPAPAPADTLLGAPDARVIEARTDRAERRTLLRQTHLTHEPAGARPLQAGDPISLAPGFFATPLTGGVGANEPPVIVQSRGWVVVYSAHGPRRVRVAATGR